MLQTALQEHLTRATQEPLMAGTAEVDGITQLGLDSQSVAESAVESAIEFIKQWLKDSGMLPSREEFRQIVSDAFDTYLASHFKRPFVARAAKALLLMAALELYDAASLL